MANTLTGLIPTLYEARNVVSRELTGFITGVRLDAQSARAAKDQIVRVPVAAPRASQDIVPAVTAPDTGDSAPESVDVTISKSKMVPIRWNGEEQRAVGTTGVYNQLLADQFAEAMRVLVNEMETDLGAEAYANSSRAYGTAGTAPFGTANDLTDVAGPRQILDDNGSPQTDLQMVNGSAAWFNLRGKQSSLWKVNEAGTPEFLREGMISQGLQGFAMRNSAGVASHTKGTGTGYLVNDASGLAVGTKVIPVDTGTGTIVAGDVVTFAADANNKYVATSAISGGSFSIGGPGLRVAIPDNNAVTVGDDYTANMAFARSAILSVARAPALPIDLNGNAADMADDRITVQDPVTGIPFDVAVYRQYHQIQFQVAMAWGQRAIKSEHIATLLG